MDFASPALTTIQIARRSDGLEMRATERLAIIVKVMKVFRRPTLGRGPRRGFDSGSLLLRRKFTDVSQSPASSEVEVPRRA